LVGRTRRAEPDAVVPGAEEWPEGWTDEELQALAGDVEPPEGDGGPARRDAADAMRCCVG
jgi:hypothetical protein